MVVFAAAQAFGQQAAPASAHDAAASGHEMSYHDMARAMEMDDTARLGKIMVEQLEWRNGGAGDARAAWDAQAWYGGDYNKIWLKTEGSYVPHGNRYARARAAGGNGSGNTGGGGGGGRGVDASLGNRSGRGSKGGGRGSDASGGGSEGEDDGGRGGPGGPGGGGDGDGSGSEGDLRDASLDILWSRVIAPWWSLQVGGRQDIGVGQSRTWAAVGLQGFSPQWLEVDATFYASDEGRVASRLKTQYELLLTQRLILQPYVEANLYSRADPRRQIGTGLSDIEVSLRLRFEVRRELAPYVGVVWLRRFGGTADFLREAGESASDVELVAGLRAWF